MEDKQKHAISVFRDIAESSMEADTTRIKAIEMLAKENDPYTLRTLGNIMKNVYERKHIREAAAKALGIELFQ